MKNIKLADDSGFCFGVDRAINGLQKLIDDQQKVALLGPIIHNPQMMKHFEDIGVLCIDTIDELPKDYTLVIRAHGIPLNLMDKIITSSIKYYDYTCPFVSAIQKIANEQALKGDCIFIAGDKSHPEVVGIIGYCEPITDVYVFADESDLKNIIINENLLKKSITLIAQTTFNINIWKNCIEILKKVCTNVQVFDTICNATIKRQKNAELLSKQCDYMVIVGGKCSSNTTKLFDICKKHCDCNLIETARDLDLAKIKNAKFIGVTAGASTPSGIIEEVLNTMDEITKTVTDPTANDTNTIKKTFEEMSFEEALEASLNSLNTDQKVKGLVLSVGLTEVQVDIGRKHAGYVPVSELTNDPSVNASDIVKVGDEIDLIVMKTNDLEGTVLLSKKRYDAHIGWDKVLDAKDTGEILDGVVTEVIKGGVIAVTNGVRVFVPASQASTSRGEDLNLLIKKPVSVKILEINRGRRAVGSIKDGLYAERKTMSDSVWNDIIVGKEYNGVVKSIMPYGAFVDIGGVDGLLHISELSWKRIKDPTDVINVGDAILVYVKDVNDEKHKISLSYRKSDENPWVLFNNQYELDQIVNVTICGLTAYGAFATIVPGVDGLIHVSQMSDQHVTTPQSVFKVGQKVDAKIIEIDLDKKRISLSVKALLEAEAIMDDTMPMSTEATASTEETAPAENPVSTEEAISTEE